MVILRLILAVGGLAAVGPASALQASSTQAAPSAAVTNAWERVVAAQSWAQQAFEIRGFLNAVSNDGYRPNDVTMDARNIASGRAVAADDPELLQRPQAHEITLTLDGRFYVFRPLSRASVEPLQKR